MKTKLHKIIAFLALVTLANSRLIESLSREFNLRIIGAFKTYVLDANRQVSLPYKLLDADGNNLTGQKVQMTLTGSGNKHDTDISKSREYLKKGLPLCYKFQADYDMELNGLDLAKKYLLVRQSKPKGAFPPSLVDSSQVIVDGNPNVLTQDDVDLIFDGVEERMFEQVVDQYTRFFWPINFLFDNTLTKADYFSVLRRRQTFGVEFFDSASRSLQSLKYKLTLEVAMEGPEDILECKNGDETIIGADEQLDQLLQNRDEDDVVEEVGQDQGNNLLPGPGELVRRTGEGGGGGRRKLYMPSFMQELRSKLEMTIEKEIRTLE